MEAVLSDFSNKFCYACKETKLKSNFYSCRSKPDKLSSECKPCNKIKSKEWAVKNKENKNEYIKKYNQKNIEQRKQTSRKYELKRTYGISLLQYELMLKAQNNSCKICLISKDSLKRDLAVDHCHKTGKIRGLLCNNCNVGIGNFKDSKELLINAIQYLSDLKGGNHA